jgi:UDP-glucose 4-epimerase
MKQYGVSQLIFASTAAVYKPNILLTEHDLLLPNTPYGWSKLYCEQAIQRSDISAYILRLFNVGGALNTLLLGENHDPETHFIPLAIEANIHQRDLILYGKNKEVFTGCTRDYIHVADVINAFLRCLDRPLRNNHHEILNICSNKGYRVEEIVALTESLAGKKTKTILHQLPKNESYILVGNHKRARQVLGWCPTKSIEDLIQSAWMYQTQQNSEIITI